MSVQLQKNALDLGIVTCNETAMWAFYCEVLGLPPAGDVVLAGVGRVRKLQCGDSVIKMFVPSKPPAESASRGGYAAASGYRYCSLTVRNLDEIVGACRDAGHRVAVPPVELRPGTFVAMVEDPDGNTIELFEVRQ